MAKLELKLPPLVVMALCSILMWLAKRYSPGLSFDAPGTIVLSLIVTLLGLLFGGLGIYEFQKERTTVNPHNPHSATKLVETGIYQFTRNPMYIGLFLILVGWLIKLQNYFSVIGLPLFLAYITRFQVVPEEKILEEKFGSKFIAYASRVRRWF